MDNEPEIWSGTHDDVMPQQLSPDEFMDRYFEVAKKARAIFPDLKLVGPVTANEWQWYNWDGKPISDGGKSYPWLEYFIKRIGEEEQASGIRLLDVLDIHFYPYSNKAEELVQMHRVYFDKNYIFPEANGVKTINGGWDNTINKEYIFERCKEWLDEYLGVNHGVKLAVSETGIANNDPNVAAVWYASTLGEFMKHPEMEFFTPWSWKTGMWEVLHLFSRYNRQIGVKSVSSDEEYVSAYATSNASSDSLTVVLLNRSTQDTRQVIVNLTNFTLTNKHVETLSLYNLPTSETFMSNADNALKKSEIIASGNTLQVDLPPLSVTALSMYSGGPITDLSAPKLSSRIHIFPNPTYSKHVVVEINAQPISEEKFLKICDLSGKTVFETSFSQEKQDLNLQGINRGIYVLFVQVSHMAFTKKLVIQ